MSWSWKLGRVAGIPIYMHWTFLALIAWIVLSHRLEGHDFATTVTGVAFVLTLFGCVVLHELGHALMARRFGVSTTDITLLPIGGIARLRRIPENPGQEFAIALAGPAVNVAIVASLFLAGVRATADVGDPQVLVRTAFLPRVMVVNVFLAVFNLLPAFPMDGGRVFRALLAMRLDYAKATRIAADVGQVMAIGFGFLGLAVGNPVLVLIAAFVWIGAEAEAYQVQVRSLVRDVLVRDAMGTEFEAVRPDDPLEYVADRLLGGTQRDFPVESGGRIVGFLTRDDLAAGLAREGAEARVADFYRPGIDTVQAGEPLATAFDRLGQGDVSCLQVLDGDTPVGLLTREHIQNFLMIRAAGRTGRRPKPRARRRGQETDSPAPVAAP